MSGRIGPRLPSVPVVEVGNLYLAKKNTERNQHTQQMPVKNRKQLPTLFVKHTPTTSTETKRRRLVWGAESEKSSNSLQCLKVFKVFCFCCFALMTFCFWQKASYFGPRFWSPHQQNRSLLRFSGFGKGGAIDSSFWSKWKPNEILSSSNSKRRKNFRALSGTIDSLICKHLPILRLPISGQPMATATGWLLAPTSYLPFIGQGILLISFPRKQEHPCFTGLE